jgi:hypothetical protein
MRDCKFASPIYPKKQISVSTADKAEERQSRLTKLLLKKSESSANSSTVHYLNLVEA